MKKLLIPSALLAVALWLPTSVQAQESDMFDILANYINDEQNSSLVRLQEDIAKGENMYLRPKLPTKLTLSFSTVAKKANSKKVRKNLPKLNRCESRLLNSTKNRILLFTIFTKRLSKIASLFTKTIKVRRNRI